MALSAVRFSRSRGHAALALVVALAVLAAKADLAAAKRGCSAFGHSCFGGHGKRADETFEAANAIDDSAAAAAMGAMGPMGPMGAAPGSASLSEDEDAAAARLLLGLAARRPDAQGLRLSPFLRQWLQNYRRGDQSGDLQ